MDEVAKFGHGPLADLVLGEIVDVVQPEIGVTLELDLELLLELEILASAMADLGHAPDIEGAVLALLSHGLDRSRWLLGLDGTHLYVSLDR